MAGNKKTNRDFGQRLRQLREDWGIAVTLKPYLQQDFAPRLGLTVLNLSQIENGRYSGLRIELITKIFKLASLAGCADWLFTGEGECTISKKAITEDRKLIDAYGRDAFANSGKETDDDVMDDVCNAGAN